MKNEVLSKRYYKKGKELIQTSSRLRVRGERLKDKAHKLMKKAASLLDQAADIKLEGFQFIDDSRYV